MWQYVRPLAADESWDVILNISILATWLIIKKNKHVDFNILDLGR